MDEAVGTSLIAAADDAAAEEAPDARRRRAVSPTSVLLVASLGVFMAFIDATIVNVAFPSIRLSFPTATLGSLSWVLNAYNVVFAAFLVPAGRFSDLLGRRRVFTVGVAIFTLASVLCAAAPSLGLLIAARVLQAFGAAAMVPASLALVLHAFGPARRAHAVALWGAIAAIAAGLGPAVGGLLVELQNWRLTFLVNLPIGLLAVFLAGRRLVESRAPGRRSMPDLAGAGLFALAIALLTFAIVEGPEQGWTSPLVLVPAAAAVLIGLLFARRCTWHPSPVFDIDLLRIRSFTAANTLSLLVGAGYFAYLLCNVLFLTTVWGYSELDAGLALTPAPFVAAAVARPLGRLIDRVGYAGVAIPGAIVWTTGVVLLLTVVGPTPDFVGQWLPIMAVLGVGAGATLPTLAAASVAAAPGERFATATALNSVARQLGAVLGVALLVAVVGTPNPHDAQAVLDAFDNGWTFAAACLGSAVLLGWTLGHITTPAEASAAEARAEAERIAALPTLPEIQAPAQRPAPARTSAPMPKTPAETLAEVSIFRELEPALRAEIADRAQVIQIPGGTHLFRAGDPADALYVVLGGRCEVVDATDEHILTLSRGAVVGELGLLTGAPRAASIRARRDSELLKLSRDEFERLLREEPSFAVGLTRELGTQLQASRPRATPTRGGGTSIALVPLSPDVRLDAIADGLASAIGGWEHLARLDAPSADAPQLTLAQLDELEHHHDRVLLVSHALSGPSTPDAWAEFCLRQADRIVGVAGDSPPPDWLRHHPALLGCDLVLTDSAQDAPEWLSELRPAATHLVRDATLGSDVRRVARRLTGRSVGVVLSGGGARSFAHLGVLQELLAAGIEIDRVGGTSMGAFIGALFAQELDLEEIDARCYDEWVRRNPLTDYRLPRISVIRGDKVKRMFVRNLPGSIELLPRDFFCVSSDLIGGEQVVHRTGPLAYAVSASMCLPGLAPPVADGARYLIDGGALNNLPVDQMALRAEGPIIAVDVTARTEPSNGRGSEATRARGGWPWDDDAPMPTIGETITRLVLLGSIDTTEAARRHADLVVLPDDDGVGLLEFHMLDAMRAAGRRAARLALQDAPASLFVS